MKTFTKFFLTLSAIFICQLANAQVSFSHAAGMSFFVGGEAATPAFMYAPRLNVVEFGDEATLSVGTHLSAWIVLSSRNPSSNAYALDIPLVAELNFGHGAHPDADSDFGGFVGLGYGISFLGGNNNENSASGPVANIGARMYIADKPVGLRLSFLYNTEEEGENVFGLSLFYTLGGL